MIQKQPKIKIEKEPIDSMIEIIGLTGLVLLIVLPIFYYSDLPDSIPMHYGVDGQPDSYGGKGFVWTLPIIGTIMYIGLALLNKYPHIFNYPKKITEENAEMQYKLATKLIRILNTIIICTFSHMTYITIQTSLGNEGGLGYWSLPIFLGGIFGSIGYYLYKSRKK